MSSRLVRPALIVFVALAGLALVQPRVRKANDLDSYSDARLSKDLNAELDDILVADGGTFEPNEEYPLGDLHEAIMNAFSDEDDDADEGDIDLADLNEEMEEDGTTLADAVDVALERADEIASREGARSWTMVSTGAPSFTFQNAAFTPFPQSRNQKGFTTSRVAIRQTVAVVIADIRKVRR